MLNKTIKSETMTALEFIGQCTISGNDLIFPNITLNRDTYNEVKKLLEGINGKWNKKINGFSFNSPIEKEIARILDGEKINLNKQFQFFETPDIICRQMAEAVEIKPNSKILEPSAGRGAIINAIHAVCPDVKVDVCELMPQNIEVLKQMENVTIVGEDYLQYSPSTKYDIILANPPFTKNQDIKHLQKMYNDLAIGGVMVCITSRHWQIANNKEEKSFKQWLQNKSHKIVEIPRKTFEKTPIDTLLIKIEKTGKDNDFGFYFHSNDLIEKQVKSELYGQTTAVGRIDLVKQTGFMPCGDGSDYKLTKAEKEFIAKL
jgi:phospholipid N-methyltransferase